MIDDFFNELLSGFANPKRAFSMYKKDKFNEFRRREERQNLLSSQKFYINDSLLESTIIASLSEPKALLGMLRQAKPPFNNMWIEWNESKRVELIDKHYKAMGLNVFSSEQLSDIDTSQKPEKVGYHIKNIDNMLKYNLRNFVSDAKKNYPKGSFSYNAYFSFGEKAWFEEKTSRHKFLKYRNKIIFPPYTLILNNEQQIKFETDRGQNKRLNTMGQAFGSTYKDTHKDNNIFFEICNHSSLFSHDLALFGYPKNAVAEEGVKGSEKFLDKKLANEWITMTLGFIDGDIRFIIALLSLLNYQHHIYERTDITSVPKRIKYGGTVPRNEVRVLEIDLPKPFGTKKYERIFKGFGSPKRQHKRRGHWHTYHYKNGEKRHKWIEEQLVGNPELGKIEHDYVLKRRNG